MNEQTNRQINEQMNEQTNKQTKHKINAYTSILYTGTCIISKCNHKLVLKKNGF